ncbi:XdhC family protein [Mesorhizobium sp. BAC0120]|uniref:XdhC family protein n=1 Tax=Mesorhizobium sp. BAC0120 TaxID=3090670 RepID=UPI00298CB775|nr:XdhC family protein [Mesorhizobium sp. BAC0120]MDW6022691.1 XdhC family protein [Mesorhizobium sp. BAC0120]
MDPFSLKKLNSARRERRAAILITDLGDGRDRVVEEGDEVAGALGAAVAKAFRSGVSGSIEAEGRTFFLNVHLPHPRLVAIGAVHISQALAPMAKIAGFDMEIIDPRTAFATADRFPDVPLFAEWPEDALKEKPLDSYTAVAALTHDPKIDDFALKAALDAGCFYVGALGSRKTHARRVERLLALGASGEDIERIRAPIGIDIGASSPSEIAVAVLAEIIAALRTRSAGRRKKDVAA